MVPQRTTVMKKTLNIHAIQAKVTMAGDQFNYLGISTTDLPETALASTD